MCFSFVVAPLEQQQKKNYRCDQLDSAPLHRWPARTHSSPRVYSIYIDISLTALPVILSTLCLRGSRRGGKTHPVGKIQRCLSGIKDVISPVKPGLTAGGPSVSSDKGTAVEKCSCVSVFDCRRMISLASGCDCLSCRRPKRHLTRDSSQSAFGLDCK